MELLKNSFVLVFITFAFYYLAKLLQKKTNSVLLNPLLISITLIILYLEFFGIDYETYHESGQMIEFWLKPAVVALGVPLYKQLTSIKKQIFPLIASSFVGCVLGVISVVVFANILGASHAVSLSLASKSVTTPIAMEITRILGGIESLTTVAVVFTGIFGGMFGFKILQWCGVTNPISQSLAIGMAAHAVGTSKALEVGFHYGAYSSLGLTLNGIFTAVCTQIILQMLGMI